jgi:hypothetical protein
VNFLRRWAALPFPDNNLLIGQNQIMKRGALFDAQRREESAKRRIERRATFSECDLVIEKHLYYLLGFALVCFHGWFEYALDFAETVDLLCTYGALVWASEHGSALL